MTIKYQTAVQKLRSQYVEADFGDLPSGTFVPLIELPTGALQVGGGIHVLTASDAATSEALKAGTSGADSANGTVASSKTTGRTALTLQNAPNSGKTVIGLTRTAVGAQTAGRYGLSVLYMIAGGSDATQG